LAAKSLAASDKGERAAMPLDTGTVAENLVRQVGAGLGDPPRNQQPSFEAALGVGPALRAERLRQGLDLQAVADDTRVRRVYLEGIENMRIEGLPSRPFLIGYVRAYALTLGLDPELVVRRFKQDFPDTVEPFRAPVGVRKRKDGRLLLLAGGLVVVIVAIGGWNIARRATAGATAPTAAPAVPDSATPETATSAAVASSAAAPPSGVLAVSAAEPAPQDSTLPTPYKTPGLDPGAQALAVPGVAASKAVPAVSATPGSAAPAADLPAEAPAPATFTAKGMVYGAEPAQSAVTLQAKKSVTLVVHNPDGSVFFARQMAAGESFRAPSGRPLSADVSDPSSFNVYVNGSLHAGLSTSTSSLGSLAN
jgi:cytoskeletal protein RodZ